MSKTPKLQAALQAKCPRCRRGNIYDGPMYSFGTQRMNEYCPHCGFRFEIEPGYFYAAMYVSYAFNVMEIVISAIFTFYLSGGNESPWLYIGVIFGVVVIMAPFNLRYSRVVLLHWLSPKVKYNPELDK